MADRPAFTRPPGFRLRTRLGLPFLAAIAFMAGVVGYMVYSSYQLQVQYAQERQRQAAAQASSQVASAISLFRAQLDDAARGLMYAGASSSQQRDWLERVQRAHRHFYDLAMTDLSGQETARAVWLSPDYLRPLRSQAGTPAFETASGGQFYLGRVYLSEEFSSPFVQMALPVYNAGGLIAGTLLAEVDLSHLWAAVMGVEAGQAGYVYVVDGEGRLIAYRESELVQGPLLRLPRVQPVPAVSAYLERGGQGGLSSSAQYPSGLLCMLRQQCGAVLAYQRSIEDTAWTVIVEQPVSAAYAQANELLGLAIILLAVALIIFILSGGYIQRRVLSPLRVLSEGAAALASGRLGQRISLRSGDELEVLAGEFNVMAESLQASQAQLEEYARTLEQRVVERTLELQQAYEALSRRAMQLEISSQVGQQVISILDLDRLLAQVVTLIQVRFGYYFVGVWLVTDKKDSVVLRAGTGRAGQVLLEQGFGIALDATSVIAGVCQSGVQRLVEDVSQSPDYLAVDVLPDTRSELVLPLQMGEQVLGALDIHSDRPAAFEADDKLVMQNLANQITISIRNAQLYAAERRRRRLAESLERAGRELSSSLNIAEVSSRILQQLETIVPYERGSVMLELGDVMCIVGQHGFPEGERAMELRVRIREGDVFQQVVAADAPVLIDDVTQVPGWRQVDWLPLNLSWMGLPLISKGRVIGMVSLTRAEAGAFSQDDAQLAGAFAAQAAVALENANLYDELSKAYQVLERLDKAKASFIEVAAHELRTPLTVIRGYAQVLGAKLGQADPDSQALLEGVVGGVDRLHEIVNSMLDVTKLDSSTLRMYKEPVQLAHVVGRVRAELATALKERRLTLSVQDLEALPVIQADADLLLKVFYQLVVNAIKYTPDGGSITISGQLLDGPAPGAVEIVVSDTGIGIAPEHQALIFEKFYQTGEVAVHSSGKTKFKGGGPGLGLAIARGIVQAHGGKLWVESEGYDEERCPGSRFHVRLPVS